MVESDYNYYTPYEGNIICMNGVTGTVFTVTKNEYDLMKKKTKKISPKMMTKI